MVNLTNTKLTLEVKNEIAKIADTYKDDNYLQRFQYIVKEYMVKSDIRGLLIYHGVGSGKSITAASIAETYRRIDPQRKIVILLSKSLQANFKGNIRKYMFNDKETHGHKSKDSINNIIESKYKFISLNASNMYKQITYLRINI